MTLKRIKRPSGRKVGRKPDWASKFLPFEAMLGEDFVGKETIQNVASIMATYCSQRELGLPIQAPRVLVVGPPSSGKTFLVQLVRKHLNLEFCTINAALVTPPGYRGTDLSVGLRSFASNLRQRANARVSLLSGIHFEEVDKLIVRSNSDDWVSSIQLGLLPVLNGEDLTLEEPESGETAPFNSRDTIVFLTGVFAAIPRSAWRDITSARAALVRYGFTKEFVSRLTHIIHLNKLSKAEVSDLVAREADAISPAFQTGKVSDAYVYLSKAQIAAIGRSTLNSPFGVRGAKALIYEALARQAVSSAQDCLLG